MEATVTHSRRVAGCQRALAIHNIGPGNRDRTEDRPRVTKKEKKKRKEKKKKEKKKSPKNKGRMEESDASSNGKSGPLSPSRHGCPEGSAARPEQKVAGSRGTIRLNRM